VNNICIPSPATAAGNYRLTPVLNEIENPFSWMPEAMDLKKEKSFSKPISSVPERGCVELGSI
jgi:hypothetical protein